MSLEREMPGIRWVETHRNDTLKRIALRELGHASRWVEIAILNNLRPPYIVLDPVDAVSGVIIAGDPLKVPAPQSVNVVSDANGIFLQDVALSNGLLVADSGVLSQAIGIDNLKQALLIRVNVLKMELMFHPEYGCHVRQLLGDGATATATALAAFYVKSALLEDERVASVNSSTAEIVGDTIRVAAVVNPISGRSIDLSVLIR